MELNDFAYLFAIAVGLVSAGIMGSLWALVAGKELRPALPRQVGDGCDAHDAGDRG
jgi:hypothetical protein